MKLCFTIWKSFLSWEEFHFFLTPFGKLEERRKFVKRN